MPEREAAFTITRRTLLRAGVGGVGALGLSRGLPAWARPIVSAAAGLRRPDSLPFPNRPAGTPAPSLAQIQHIVVLMMENHSFDNLLGMLPSQVPSRAQVDGLTLQSGLPVESNLSPTGTPVYARVASSPCQQSGAPSQSWNASHQAWDGGKNDGFVLASGPVAMELWDQSLLPFTYSLARHFPLGERYFCSVLGPTYPNRRFLFCGTASGLTETNLTASLQAPAANGTIFDRLDAHRISWRDYFSDDPSPAIVPSFDRPSKLGKLRTISHFFADAKAGKLPQLALLEPNYKYSSEEDPQDVQVGEQFVAKVVDALIKSPNWKQTALFLTYDEHGGYYDHVPPPAAIAPDSIAPTPGPGASSLAPGGYDTYGFRVPLIVVSPWAKANYVSRVVQDHTSITAFVERKWNLPAMTFRDANAAPMTDYFDFRKPQFLKPPALAKAPALTAGLAQCQAAGLTPPLQ